MANVFTRDLNDPMDEVQQKIKDKMIEVTNLELTDKASYHAYEEVYPFLLDKFIGKKCNMSVSYTHLTLPTIYSV